MLRPFQYSFVKNVLPLFVCAFVCAASFVTVKGIVLPQDDEGSSIGKRIKTNKPKTFTVKSAGSSTTTKKKTAVTKKSAPKVPAQITTYFFTKYPETEIFLNGASIGKTDQNSKLTAKVKGGEYNVTTKLNGEDITKPQTINVSSKTSRFDLVSLTIQPKVINVPTPTNTNKSTADNKAVNETKPQGIEDKTAQIPKLPSAEEILNRYKDPKKTNKVTREDWQALFYQSTMGYVPGASDTQQKAQALFALGQLKLIEGNFGDAVDAFNTSANLLPASSLAFYGLGNAYLATNQPSQAIRAYEQALKLDNKLVLAYKSLGDALAKLGKAKEALEKYEKARSMGYESIELSYNVGMNMLRQRKWSNALKELEVVVAERPSAEIYIAIGDCHRESDRAMSAAEAYRKAIELEPKSALAYFRLGELLLKEREYEQGRSCLERALVLDQEGKLINRALVRKLADNAAKKMR